MNFNNHTTVTPCCSTITWAHAIYHNLFLICSSRYDETTRRHTETIYTTFINLCYKRVFCSRKIFSPTVFIMILYLINQFALMFKTISYSNPLCLYLNFRIIKIAIYVTGTMTSGKDYRTMEFHLFLIIQRNSLNTNNFITFKDKTRHLSKEMNFSTTSNNSITHVLYHSW